MELDPVILLFLVFTLDYYSSFQNYSILKIIPSLSGIILL